MPTQTMQHDARTLRFQDQVILVTGASSGIGQDTAVAFAAEGATVAINYHKDVDGGETTRSEIERTRQEQGLPPRNDLVVKADVSDARAVDQMFDRILDEAGRLDVLVNNAGMQVEAPSHEADIEAFDKPIAVNLRGPYLCARRAIQHFCERKEGGVIVNISSVHETIPKPMYSGYAASKGGLRNLNRTLALEYAGEGIRVNSVAPGAIVTPINASWVDDPKESAEVARHIPLGRPGETDEVTPAILFLASDEARYITGQTLFVDGGLTLYPDFRTAWSS